MGSITVNTKDIEKLERDLIKFGKQAVPRANQWVLNTVARDVYEKSRAAVKGQMILRNSYTLKSVQYEKTKSLNISNQVVRIGSIADYMARQEFGGVKSGKSGNVNIPTSFSAGQGKDTQPRMKMPRSVKKNANIKLKKTRGRFYSKRQQKFVAIKMASLRASPADRFIYLNLRKSGIFQVTKARKGRKPKITMVHDKSQGSVTTPKNPWLSPAVKKKRGDMPRMYLVALRFQARRLGLFK